MPLTSLLRTIRRIFGLADKDASFQADDAQKQSRFRSPAKSGISIQVKGSEAFIKRPTVKQDELRAQNGELETPSWFPGIDRRG